MEEPPETPTRRLVGELYRIRGPVTIEPAPGSPAETERRMFKRPESVHTFDSHAQLLTEAARDNLLALDDLVAQEAYAISPWVLARASFEASALAVWLLDRQLDTSGRIGRSLALRYETLRGQRVLAQESNDAATLRKIEDRIDDVVRVASQLGLPEVYDQNGKRIGVAEQIPKKVLLAEKLLGSAALYRILSGVAHADVNTLEQLAFAAVSEPTRDGIVKAPMPATRALKPLVANVTAAYSRAAWEMVLRTGADAGEAAVALETAFTALGLKDTDEVRFWRVVLKRTA